MNLSGGKDRADFEDDDATMGHSPDTPHGIRIPNFTKDDQKYLESSASSEEYVARLMEIARKKDQQRKIDNAKSGMQTAEDYIESLRREPRDLSNMPYDSKGTSSAEDYMSSLNIRQPPDLSGAGYDSKGVNSGEEYMRKLTEMHESAAEQAKNSDALDPAEPSSSSFEKVKEFQSYLRSKSGVDDGRLTPEPEVDANKIEKDIQELESQLRKMVSEDDNEAENAPPSAEDVGALNQKLAEMQKGVYDFSEKHDENTESAAQTGPRDVSEVDKQIRFLEEYLEKLKREEAAEKVSHSNTTDDQSDDKKIDRTAMKNKVDEAMQSLGRKVKEIPKKSNEMRSNVGELSEVDKMAAFEAIRKQVMKQRGQSMPEFTDPLAAPLPEKKTDVPRFEEDDDVDIGSTKIPEAYFAVSELEAEVKKYMFDARALLDDHERRVKILLAKLREFE